MYCASILILVLYLSCCAALTIPFSSSLFVVATFWRLEYSLYLSPLRPENKSRPGSLIVFLWLCGGFRWKSELLGIPVASDCCCWDCVAEALETAGAGFSAGLGVFAVSLFTRRFWARWGWAFLGEPNRVFAGQQDFFPGFRNSMHVDPGAWRNRCGCCWKACAEFQPGSSALAYRDRTWSESLFGDAGGRERAERLVAGNLPLERRPTFFWCTT